jgi:hypothetical protein
LLCGLLCGLICNIGGYLDDEERASEGRSVPVLERTRRAAGPQPSAVHDEISFRVSMIEA